MMQVSPVLRDLAPWPAKGRLRKPYMLSFALCADPITTFKLKPKRMSHAHSVEEAGKHGFGLSSWAHLSAHTCPVAGQCTRRHLALAQTRLYCC